MELTCVNGRVSGPREMYRGILTAGVIASIRGCDRIKPFVPPRSAADMRRWTRRSAHPRVAAAPAAAGAPCLRIANAVRLEVALPAIGSLSGQHGD
jgi:hypothetical protein